MACDLRSSKNLNMGVFGRELMLFSLPQIPKVMSSNGRTRNVRSMGPTSPTVKLRIFRMIEASFS